MGGAKLYEAVSTFAAREHATVPASRPRNRTTKVLSAVLKPVGHTCSSRFVKLATIPGVRLLFRDEAINRTW